MPDEPKSEIILYQTEDGKTRVEVHLQDQTVWLSLNQLAELFQRDKSVISRHIRNIFDEGELQPKTTVAKFATVQIEGGRKITRNVEYYNLDAIISVGYRVKSNRGTQFCIWATKRLREYIVKGFTLDDERLKRLGGGNHRRTGGFRKAQHAFETYHNRSLNEPSQVEKDFEAAIKKLKNLPSRQSNSSIETRKSKFSSYPSQSQPIKNSLEKNIHP